jgi:hypothetical protein
MRVHTKTNSLTWFFYSLLLLLVNSCKKFIEVPAPTTSITEATVFSNDQTAIAAVTGLYSLISRGGSSDVFNNISLHVLSIPKLAGLSADEFSLWSGASEVERAYYENNLQTHFQSIDGSIEAGSEYWNWLYPIVYSTNQALENLENATNLSPRTRQQLQGECRFYRAFLYFYLVNLYGDVPLALSTSPETNRKLKRSPKADVYAQIMKDLKDAQSLLNENFVNNGLLPYSTGAASERTRPCKWAATALLSRSYLYTNAYAKAAEAATEVINNTTLFELPSVPLNAVFRKNSQEAIWQLQPVRIGWNTPESRMFVLNADPVGFSTGKSVYLSQSLLQAFEAGDARQKQWLGTYSSTDPAGDFYYPSKYTDAISNPDITPETGTNLMTEYSMVLRLAEQYLIRAEARAFTGDLPGSIADLNILRTRARDQPTQQVPGPLPDLPATLNQTQVVQAVWHEKRIELFAEWGHRWLDLKRTGQINTVMELVTPQKGGVWQSTDMLYPLPAIDLHRAPQLTQNPGY